MAIAPSALSKRKTTILSIFSLTVLVATILVLKFSSQKIAWLIGLTASIPLFAAILGGLPEPNEKSKD